MILQNAFLTPEGEIICSTNVHHLCSSKDGKYFTDGGSYYIRTTDNINECKSLILGEDSSLESCKEKAVWGTYGKTGKDPLHFIFLKNAETEHLKNILEQLSLYPQKENKKGFSKKEIIESILEDRDIAVKMSATG